MLSEKHTAFLQSAAIFLLVLLALLLCSAQVIKAPFQINIDYNEGWNAFHAARLYSGKPLYPDYDDLTANNYPPLSFVIVGAVGKFVGDYIIAGRFVALLSLMLVATTAGLCIYRTTGSRFAGGITSLSLFALASKVSVVYVAMNDPQWLAHAIAMCGFLLLITYRSNTAAIVASATLLVAAGFVKHNLLPMPIAIGFWLMVFYRRSFLIWVFAAVIALTAMFGITYSMFGENMLTGLFIAPRAYSTDRLMRLANLWLQSMLPSLIVGMFIVTALGRRRDAGDFAWLIVFYLVVSATFGLYTLGGEGVDINALFDLLIASSMAAGFVIKDFDSHAQGYGFKKWVPLAGVTVLLFGLIVSVPDAARRTLHTLRELHVEVSQTAEDIKFISSHADPVMCEKLSLCYWAGREFAVDYFMTGQKMMTGSLDEGRLDDLIRQKHFSLIQKSGRSGSNRLPKAINRAIAENYQPVRSSSVGGTFLEPR
jgi:hypothetical protein